MSVKIGMLPIQEKKNQNKNTLFSNAIINNIPKNILLNLNPQVHASEKSKTPNIIIKNYPTNNVKLGGGLKQNINKVLVHGLMVNDINLGTYQLNHPDASLEKIATHLKTSSEVLKNKMGDMSDLKNTYYKGNQLAGIASVATGVNSLVNFTTNIFDIYNDIQYHKKRNSLTEKKEAVFNDFTKKISQEGLSDKELNTLKQNTLEQINAYDTQGKQAELNLKKQHHFTNDVNQGSNLISSASNLMIAKNMFTIIANPKTIPQAISAFGFGAGASFQTVAAIKIGMGLLATGMTISSIATMLNTVNHFKNHKQDTDKKIPDTKKNQKYNDLLNGSTKLMNSVGNLVLLKNTYGYEINELLNNNKMLLGKHHNPHFSKLLTYISTYSILFDSVKSLLNVYINQPAK